jgi:hypothetical protein
MTKYIGFENEKILTLSINGNMWHTWAFRHSYKDDSLKEIAEFAHKCTYGVKTINFSCCEIISMQQIHYRNAKLTYGLLIKGIILVNVK